MTWPTNCPQLPPNCDCTHPGECTFAPALSHWPAPWIIASLAAWVIMIGLVILLVILL